MDNGNVSPIIACRPSMLGFKRRSLNKVQSSPSKATVKSASNAGDKMNAVTEVESTSTVVDAHQNPVKETCEKKPEPIPSVTATEFAEPTEIARKPAQQGFSGVTMRKKLNSSNTTLLGHSNGFDNRQRSPGTSFYR